MDPYNVADRVYTAGLIFDRQDHKGDRFFTYPVRCERDGDVGHKQEFFYRAMKRDEAAGWLAQGRTATPDPNGHHPWASYRGYSLSYLTRKNGYVFLLEVSAPDFIPWMKSIGFTGGKAEAGDMSWGIGGTSSNSWGGTQTSNATLRDEYAKYANNGVAVNHNNVPGGLRAMAVRLAPIYFRQAIKWVKVVNFRSEATG
ncbi:MAG: hypothetical protein ACRD19_09980 [Terriglobia bacterium]